MFLLGFDFAYAGGVFLLTFWIGFDFAYAGGVFLLTVIDFCLIFFGFFDDGGGVFLLTIVDFCWIFFAIVLDVKPNFRTSIKKYNVYYVLLSYFRLQDIIDLPIKTFSKTWKLHGIIFGSCFVPVLSCSC